MKIITLEGQALADLLAELLGGLGTDQLTDLLTELATGPTDPEPGALAEVLTSALAVHTLRVARDGDAVKFKINEGMWAPPYRAADEDLRRDAFDQTRQVRP